jgi:hypothetical protein
MERGTLGSCFGLKGLSITVLLLSNAGLAVAEPIIYSGIELRVSFTTSPGSKQDLRDDEKPKFQVCWARSA